MCIRDSYDAALHVNPDYALALWDKALIEADMEEFEAALEGLDRVLELSPYSAAIIYKDKGNIYYKMEEWEKSLQAFNQSLELDPYYTYAVSYTHLNSLSWSDEMGGYLLVWIALYLSLIHI